jgi:hypothetical protein
LSAQRKQVDAEVQGAQAELKRLTDSETWQKAKTAADVAGIVDPTPTTDVISMGMSVAEGDYIGAGLSGLSLIPWLGDAVAKPIKAIKAGKTILRIKEAMAVVTKKLNAMGSAMARNKEAAKRVRNARKRAVNACQSCDSGAKWGTQLPQTGSFKGERGNSLWTSADGKTTVPYKDGYPDFTKATGPKVPGKPVHAGSVEIEMKGNHGSDFTAARDQMRTQANNPYWPGKSADDPLSSEKMPDGYTWHHGDDGATMHLVRKDVHDRASSGAAHTGGASITRDPEF